MTMIIIATIPLYSFSLSFFFIIVLKTIQYHLIIVLIYDQIEFFNKFLISSPYYCYNLYGSENFSVKVIYIAMPNSEPIPALTIIASVPQTTTRSAPNMMRAPPTFAATPPSNAKNRTAITDITRIR